MDKAWNLGTTGTSIACIGGIVVLAVFIFSLHPAEIISSSIDKMGEKRAKNREHKKSTISSIQVAETPRERRLREKAARAKQKEELEEQITININDTQKADAKPEEQAVDVPNFKTGKKGIISKLGKAKDFKILDGDMSYNNEEGTSPDSNKDLFAQKEIEKETKTKEVLQLQHTMTEAELNYEFPPISILQAGNRNEELSSRKTLLATAEKLRKTLYSFGVSAKVENVSVGPAITRYELAPAEGVRVSKIANLSDDIALSLEAETIRIEAPIPGKHTVGIEVPNKSKSTVALRDIIETDEFQDSESKLAFALGKDVAGEEIVTDIAKMPHVLIAGSTGSRKVSMYQYIDYKYYI